MPAPDAKRRVKTPFDAAERMALQAKIDLENLEDAKLMSSGARIINRSGDRRKDAFIDRYLRQTTSELESEEPTDLVDEAEAFWSQNFDSASTTVRAVVEREIERSFALAQETIPSICNVHAQTILLSDYQARQLRDEPAAQVTPRLVDAHLRALGFAWSTRVRCSVARRVAIILMNAHMWSPGWARGSDSEEPMGEMPE